MVKKMLWASSLAAVFAQDLSAPISTNETVVEPAKPAVSSVSTYSFSAPKAAAATPAKEKETKADFDALRGNSYLSASHDNVAAAFTVADQMLIPHLWAQSKTFYIEPDRANGVAVFPGMGSTLILGFNNDDGNGVTTFGMASGKMGWSVSLGTDWTSQTNETVGAGASSSTASAIGSGTQLGVKYSMDLGAAAFWASADYSKWADEVDTENSEDSFYDFEIDLNYGNFPSNPKTYWVGNLSFDRHEQTEETTVGTNTTTAVNGHTLIGVGGAIATSAFSSSEGRVLTQLAGGLNAKLYDDVTGSKSGHSDFSLDIAPSVMGEYGFSASWIAFGGLAHAHTLIERAGHYVQHRNLRI